MWQFVGLLGGLGGRFGVIMCEDSTQFKAIPEDLLDVIEYNPNTGETSCNVGFIKEEADRRIYRHPQYGQFNLTRIIWRKQTGEDPGLNVVDHKDTDPFNDKWYNLRLATRTQNSHNRSVGSNNTSGVKGVIWDKIRGKWRARIQSKGKLLYSAYFDDLSVAAQAISEKRKELHGEFARDR